MGEGFVISDTTSKRVKTLTKREVPTLDISESKLTSAGYAQQIQCGK